MKKRWEDEGTAQKKLQLVLVPKEFQKDFEFKDIKEEEDTWRITLVEKPDKIPEELEGKDVVENGYMNPVELSDNLLQGKSSTVEIYRRKWKEKGKTKSYFNNYKFHEPGMKATKGLGAFLKECDREEAG